MADFNHAILVDELVRDEGLRLKPYRDSVGKITIGVGRNLDDVGIDQEEAFHLLGNDIDGAAADLDKALPWWRSLNGVRQRALLNMCFNLGIDRLLEFQRALAAMQACDWDLAATEMLASAWAGQVGPRAKRLAEMVRTGMS
jgi:lysozyme